MVNSVLLQLHLRCGETQVSLPSSMVVTTTTASNVYAEGEPFQTAGAARRIMRSVRDDHRRAMVIALSADYARPTAVETRGWRSIGGGHSHCSLGRILREQESCDRRCGI